MDRLIIGITGASGAIYGIRTLQVLRAAGGIETHLVLSSAARQTIVAETDFSASDVTALADVVHSEKDIGAALSSGSFRTSGMLVAPCSVKTMGGLANSYDDTLVVRAADVCLKERRRVVLLLRETPLHAGHIEMMARVTRAGAIVMPPVPAFYHRPESIDDVVDQTVGRQRLLENPLTYPGLTRRKRAKQLFRLWRQPAFDPEAAWSLLNHEDEWFVRRVVYDCAKDTEDGTIRHDTFGSEAGLPTRMANELLSSLARMSLPPFASTVDHIVLDGCRYGIQFGNFLQETRLSW